MAPDTRIPELAHHEGSWIATLPNGVVAEFFLRDNAIRAAAAGWTVETIGTYLARINKAGFPELEEGE